MRKINGKILKISGVPSVVTGHVVEGHGLAEFVILTELLWLLEQVYCAVDVLFLQVVDRQDVANLAQLLAGSSEL